MIDINTNNIVSDDFMKSKGFIKRKTYAKKKEGISSMGWFFKNSLLLNIEKWDCEDFYRPVLRVNDTNLFITDEDQIDDLLKLLGYE